MVGASYVSLECAGFLAALGLDVTVMVRPILLRGFDQQMAEEIGSYMANHGVKFVRPCVPEKVSVCLMVHASYITMDVVRKTFCPRLCFCPSETIPQK